MAGSLKDQLLKMGLADEKKAKKLTQEQRQKQKQAKKARQSGKEVVDERALKQKELAKQREEKKEQDRQLNEARNQERIAKEIEAQCRQMITQQQIAIPSNAELTYNFVYEDKVKKLNVDNRLQQQIQRGQVAIAVLEESFYLIPDVFAQKIEERLPNYVVRIQPEEEVLEDDPYADYQIPDDLMW